jgi:hypothetical protein
MSDKEKTQGLLVRGTLSFIKYVEGKEYDGKKTPPSQKLQITVMNDDGLSIIEVKDSDFKFKSDFVGKEIEIPVAYTAMNGNIYFRLIG